MQDCFCDCVVRFSFHVSQRLRQDSNNRWPESGAPSARKQFALLHILFPDTLQKPQHVRQQTCFHRELIHSKSLSFRPINKNIEISHLNVKETRINWKTGDSIPIPHNQLESNPQPSHYEETVQHGFIRGHRPSPEGPQSRFCALPSFPKGNWDSR